MTDSVDWIRRASALTPAVRNVIGGRSHSPVGPELSAKHSPRDGQVLWSFANSASAEVDEAVESARAAFRDGRWASMPVGRRAAILCKLGELVDSHREELALLESVDVGKPIRETLAFDVPKAAEIIRISAEIADKLDSRVYAADGSNLSYEQRRPIGVVAGIVGWNFPLYLAAQKIGPVLATGNSLVLKPSEVTSLATWRMAELALEAGVPEGVFNVIHGNASTGEALALHSDVDMLTFTGSTRTGKQLLSASGRSNLKRSVLECGGKAPAIVFEDFDSVDAIADSIVASAFWNQGQVCVASTRLLVQRSIKDQILRAVIEKTAQITMGDPLLIATTFGPVVSHDHQRKINRYVNEARKDGLHLVYESTSAPPFAAGAYVAPVIFDAVPSRHRIAQEEIFGPVLSVLTFTEEEEAISLANDTIYGLSATIWTKDARRIRRLAQQINAGLITVHSIERACGGPGEGVVPVGGHKQSGIGVEGGIEGLKAYTLSSTIQWFT